MSNNIADSPYNHLFIRAEETLRDQTPSDLTDLLRDTLKAIDELETESFTPSILGKLAFTTNMTGTDKDFDHVHRVLDAIGVLYGDDVKKELVELLINAAYPSENSSEH